MLASAYPTLRQRFSCQTRDWHEVTYTRGKTAITESHSCDVEATLKKKVMKSIRGRTIQPLISTDFSGHLGTLRPLPFKDSNYTLWYTQHWAYEGANSSLTTV